MTETKFGWVRRGQHFWYNNEEWVRTKGTFAIKVADIGKGHVGWSFKVSTIVLIAAQ